MRRKNPLFRWFALVVICLVAARLPLAAQEPMRAILDEEARTLRVEQAGDLLFAYRFEADRKFPFFYPVNGPVSGSSVTTESTEPYPHHSSLWFGCDRVNGGNYWQEGLDRGRIVQESLRILQAEGAEIAFATVNRWMRPGAAEPFIDHRLVRVRWLGPAAYCIDFSIRLVAQEEVAIPQTNHALFSARMAPALSAGQGGSMVNATGASGEKTTFGQPSPWMDISGVWPETDCREGLAILNHPANRWSPPPWFTRDYGFFSPTPMYWPSGDAHRFAKGESINLAYRVIVHAGSAQDAGIADHYKDWSETEFPLVP